MSKTPKPPYTVGYGKPPTARQFKKGQSGNPAGRPKGSQNLATLWHNEMSAPVTINEGGQRITKPVGAIIIMRLLRQAAAGDMKAMELFLKYVAFLSPPDEGSNSSTLTPGTNDLLLALEEQANAEERRVDALERIVHSSERMDHLEATTPFGLDLTKMDPKKGDE